MKIGEKMESIEEILENIKEEFEEIGDPLQEGSDRINELQNSGIVLPDDLHEFLKQANGILRVRGDKYFSFKLFPIEEYVSYNEFMHISDDECENDQFEELCEGDNPKDFVVIGNEGEYGYFLINCNSDSANYGKVYCVVVNIPENVGIWDTFYKFFKGLIQYVAENPIKKYKQTYITSEPTYIKKINEEKTPRFVFNEEDYVNRDSYNGVILPKEEIRLLCEIEQLIGEEIPLLDDLNNVFLGYSVENARVSKLKVYGSVIAYIPENIGDLSALAELNISDCGITTLPNSLFTLKSLKRLTLYGNTIAFLSQNIEKLQALEELNIGRNTMSFIPDQIGK
ncbi:MAG: hypothetical protein GF383_04455, partial [Candidatus Lokiarchaeota archaeon]|nr:hypothetical protein [Candidatus Lokiarchaeota archaeon]